MTAAPYPAKKIYNKKLNQKEFFQGRVELLSMPLHVQVGTNLTCNLKCIFCRRTSPREASRIESLKPNEREMSFTIIDKIKDLIPYAETFNITPFGEPFMFSKLPDLLEEYKKFNSDNLAITTNCTLINEKNARLVIESGVKTMFLSIDTCDINTYEEMRFPGKFHKVEEGLNYINHFKKKLNSPKPNLVLTSTFMKKNLYQMAALPDFAKRHNIDELSIQLMEISSPELADEDLAKDLLSARKEINITKAKCAAMGIKVYVNIALQNLLDADERPKPGKPKRYKDGESPGKVLIEKCTYPFYFVYIDTNGDVRPCCWAAIRLGNLNHQTFDEVWNGEVAQETRRAFYANYIPEGCRNKHCRVDL